MVYSTNNSSSNITLYLEGEGDRFTSSANITDDSKMTTIINELHSSITSIPWSSWIGKTGLTVRDTMIIILLIVNISLTLMTLIVVFKSIRQANIIAEEKSYRYTLL
jgi:hypothetical protein